MMVCGSEKEVFVYVLLFPNGKGYVGITCNLRRRYSAHRTSRSAVGAAWRKHGAPVMWVGATGLKRWAAEFLERDLIKRLDTKRNGYNCTDGADAVSLGMGMTGMRHSQETIEKMKRAAASRRLAVWPFPVKRNRTLSSEHKAKIGAAMRGKKRTEHQRANISAGAKGRALKQDRNSKGQYS